MVVLLESWPQCPSTLPVPLRGNRREEFYMQLLAAGEQVKWLDVLESRARVREKKGSHVCLLHD